MNILQDLVVSQDVLADGLKENALSHNNYVLYTSMAKALEFMLTGNLYLYDGSKWNDTKDRAQMKSKGVFARCFSYSTKENVALWMLYGDRNGKNGASINLPRAAITEAVSSGSVRLLEISGNQIIHTIDLDREQYSIFISDILYTDHAEDDREKLTYQERHEAVPAELLNHPDIFVKKYEWKYENECRLAVRLSADAKELTAEKHKENSYWCVEVHIPSHKKLKMDRLVRSPIYKGNVLVGKKSALQDDVEWDF